MVYCTQTYIEEEKKKRKNQNRNVKKIKKKKKKELSGGRFACRARIWLYIYNIQARSSNRNS